MKFLPIRLNAFNKVEMSAKCWLCWRASIGLTAGERRVISALTAETHRNGMTALSYIMFEIDKGRKAAPPSKSTTCPDTLKAV